MWVRFPPPALEDMATVYLAGCPTSPPKSSLRVGKCAFVWQGPTS